MERGFRNLKIINKFIKNKTMPKLYNFLRIENFLNINSNKALLSYCYNNETDFIDSRVGKSREDGKVNLNYRICKTNYNLGEFKLKLEKEINANFDFFCESLKIKPFEINDIELQIAAHGDGAFFKPHIDTHTEIENNSKNRVISAVYYFFNEPRQFEGGELLLHPFNFMKGEDSPITLSPINNSLVIFPSFGMHEVLPVSCPNVEFKNWRFAINCWINKE
jgi:SM-20-related protein